MVASKELYKEKQEEVINEFVSILNLENKHKYSLYELENSGEIQKQIIELLPKINKWFSLTVLISSGKRQHVRLPWNIIINKVLNTRYTIESNVEKLNINNKWIISDVYAFEKKTE